MATTRCCPAGCSRCRATRSRCTFRCPTGSTRPGLTVAIAATNVGERACPYACGQHPSLSAGGCLLDDCLLQFGAKTRVDTDPVRQLPTGTVPVSGSRFDFGTPRRLGSLTIDYAFRDLDRDDEGRAELRLTRPDGSTVAAWWTATSRCSRFTPRAS